MTREPAATAGGGDEEDRRAQAIIDPSAHDPASAASIVLADRASVALALRRARRHAGLSQRALARRAGVADATVTRIESEMVDATVTTLIRLFDAAGVTLEVSGLSVPTFLFGCVQDMRDAAGRRPPVHRLDEAGFGYWDPSPGSAARRAAADHVATVDFLKWLHLLRLRRRRPAAAASQGGDSLPA